MAHRACRANSFVYLPSPSRVLHELSIRGSGFILSRIELAEHCVWRLCPLFNDLLKFAALSNRCPIRWSGKPNSFEIRYVAHNSCAPSSWEAYHDFENIRYSARSRERAHITGFPSLYRWPAGSGSSAGRESGRRSTRTFPLRRWAMEPRKPCRLEPLLGWPLDRLLLRSNSGISRARLCGPLLLRRVKLLDIEPVVRNKPQSRRGRVLWWRRIQRRWA